MSGSFGSSESSEMPMTLRKASVVLYSVGRPGASSLPVGSMRPLSTRDETVYELSTPRTSSTYARVTGWK